MWKWIINIILLSVVQASKKVDGQISPRTTSQKILQPYPCNSPHPLTQFSQKYPNSGYLCYPQNEINKYLWYPPWSQWVGYQGYQTGNGLYAQLSTGSQISSFHHPNFQIPFVQLLTLPAPPSLIPPASPIPSHQYPGLFAPPSFAQFPGLLGSTGSGPSGIPNLPGTNASPGWSSPGSSIPSYQLPGIQQQPGSSPVEYPHAPIKPPSSAPAGWSSPGSPIPPPSLPGLPGTPDQNPWGSADRPAHPPASPIQPGWSPPGSSFPPSPQSGPPGPPNWNQLESANRPVYPPEMPIPPVWNSRRSSNPSAQLPPLQEAPLGSLGPSQLPPGLPAPPSWSSLESSNPLVQRPELMAPPSLSPSGSSNSVLQPLPAKPNWRSSGSPNSPLYPPGLPAPPSESIPDISPNQKTRSAGSPP
uniref:BG642163, isoform A n=2 Tax=Drosophila melanogaster TaxID=7227 RepID=Q3HKQ0_DROME|nr:BG642163, isoform A [Drosophila melanogaster]NP_001285604.1 BG642163, isoform B [Drosophila melanogaster]AOQ14367.1 BG642163-PA [synthetic construct]ABA71714.1 male accessory gland protein [Drosophila melanogaster]ABI31286.1 BG642163, isoform A [Drosophila melanogaster]AHN54119.1 BG642163, isoform B [Drosophila melanogaster]|eukprot:NP_001036331.1 BG642163, isoform A [Drosophila melanogaster]